MTGNFTVLSSDLEARLRKLEAFYAAMRDIAIKTNLHETATIYVELSKVNPKWNESLYDDFDNG
jgi:hypothetical protein